MGDVSNNSTQLTVSQYFNQNLRSPLHSVVQNWLNGCGQKKHLEPCRRGGWGIKIFRPLVGSLGACSPIKF